MVNPILQQLHAVAGLASGQTAERPTASMAGGFAQELQRSLAKISQAQEASYAQAQSYELGDPGVSLSDVMIDMQKAGIAFQTAVQVRNRLVSAYQEIASMPV